MAPEGAITLNDSEKELIPNGTRVLIGEIGKVHDEILSSGLVMPAYEAQRKGLRKGIVLSIGPLVRNHHLEEHMTVYFLETVAFEIIGKTIIDESDIMAYEVVKS